MLLLFYYQLQWVLKILETFNDVTFTVTGRMKKDSIEYFHCQRCYNGLEDIAKQIEQLLLNPEIFTGDTVNKLEKLGTSLSKLFKKLETT